MKLLPIAVLLLVLCLASSLRVGSPSDSHLKFVEAEVDSVKNLQAFVRKHGASLVFFTSYKCFTCHDLIIRAR